MKLIVWGDAIFQGLDVVEETREYYVVQNHCFEIVENETGIQMVNHSEIGLNSTKALEKLKNDLAKEEQYDYGVIGVCNNDCDYNWNEVAKNPNLNHKPHTSSKQYLSNIQEMVFRMQERGITPIIINFPPIQPYHFFAWITNGGNDPVAILRPLGMIKSMAEVQEEYNSALTNYAKEAGVALVDFRKAFLSEDRAQYLLSVNGAHLNGKGHALLAAEVMKTLNQLK